MKHQELSPVVHEIITILAEEASEVTQEICKIIRFGLDENRRHLLEKEIGDLLAMIDLLEREGIITQSGLKEAKQAKHDKLKLWSNIYEQKYSGPCSGKVNVIDKITGERKQIPKEQFDKSQYESLGNKIFMFLCKNVLTKKEKFVNIYEWHLVKDQYEILNMDAFNRANNKK